MAKPTPPCPPTWLGTLFFESSFVAAGWSERYWITGPGPNTALNNLLALKDLRRSLMSTNYLIKYARVSNPSVKGDAYVQAIDPAVQAGLIDKRGLPPEMAFLHRSNTTNGHHAIRPMHGLAFDQVLPVMEIDPTVNAWAANLAMYQSNLVLNFKLWLKDFGGAGYTLYDYNDFAGQNVRERRVGRPFDVYRVLTAKRA